MKVALQKIATNSLITLFFCCGFATLGWSQNEDSLGIKVFDHNDLDSDGFQKKTVSSANRLAENPEDLAQEIIIISGEEIRKNGYSTLVDVLNSIPGFRTSQPGNSVEGETFLMRGLNGNDYTMILINGIPVKPEAVKGMPIAAQLPIRHAEYIEIVQGPSSSTYGSDAMAGVINIVFPEVDRPVFAWADVSARTPQFTEFNLTLGGKAGNGKNILNYELFASSQVASDVNLLIPDDSTRVNDSLVQTSPLFFSEPGNKSQPEIDDLKRESRLMGTHLRYRWFEFDAMNMYRQEHSGFGSNPLNSSYHDPSLTYGENINLVSLKYNDVNTEKRYQSRAALSALTYRTLTNSAYYAVTDNLSNGRNYVYARSLDLRSEYQGTYKISKLMKIVFGTTLQYSTSHPFTSYLDRPFKPADNSFNLNANDQVQVTTAVQTTVIDETSQLDSTVWIEKYTAYNVAGFAHYLYKAKSGKFNMELGSRIDINGNDGAVFTPKVGVVYRPTRSLKIVGYYAKGHRAPRSYYLYNNYRENLLLVNDTSSHEGLKRRRDTLSSEKLHGGEFRVEWNATKHLKISGRYYMHVMKNRVMREIFTEPPPNDQGQVIILPEMVKSYGFFNGEASSFLQAGMITAQYENQVGKVHWDILASYEFAKGYEEIQAGPESRETSTGYRFVPEHSFKGNITVSVSDLTVSIRNNLFGKYVTDIYVRNNAATYTETDAIFYNMDLLVHYKLFRQLSFFGGIYNLFNSVQSGIPSATVSNTWTYNPQYGRTFKFGLNFQLN